jgi:hypothetical protein
LYEITLATGATLTSAEVENDSDLDTVTIDGEEFYVVDAGNSEEFELEFRFSGADDEGDADVRIEAIQYTSENEGETGDGTPNSSRGTDSDDGVFDYIVLDEDVDYDADDAE